MAARLLMFVRAFFVVCLISTAFSQKTFPIPDDFKFSSYTTEVQLSLEVEETTFFVTEYYDDSEDQGALKIYQQGDLQSIYYDNTTNEVLEVNKTSCKSVWADISDYTYTAIYHGWLNTNPLIIGPSAGLWYAQKYRDKIKYFGTETVRDIPCDRFDLPVDNAQDKYTMKYYFAPKHWTTPYKFRDLLVPIRIHVEGVSSRFTGRKDLFSNVSQISDFAYFKPSIDDRNNLLPPVGIGCEQREESDSLPPVPKSFTYAAEVVDVLNLNEHDDVEIQFHRMWFEETRRLARTDRYTKKKGYKSVLYDFNAGAAYHINNDRSCEVTTVRDSEFEIFDYGLTGRLMTAKEALNLQGKFYEMGKRQIRGIKCDSYESVEFGAHFMDNFYYKLVVTAYFVEDFTNLGVNGEMESRIPVYMLVTGWNTAERVGLQLQYNIFEFDDVVWPEMYSSFRVDRCYTKPESKAYFVMLLQVPAKDATMMEGQDDLIMMELRNVIATHAKVPDLRITYLKADYKTTGVFVTGVMVERPPAQLQFYLLESGPAITYDPYIKASVEAKTKEECAYACIDEGDFTCKGYYFCGAACFLRSMDPFEKIDNPKSRDLGYCDEYIRAIRGTTNFRESYLAVALANLEDAVLNKSMRIEFKIPGGEEIVAIRDIIIGDGPYTGVDIGDTPFEISVELRKLDPGSQTTQTAEYSQNLHECYKRCKEAGSACASFSFCPDAAKNDKECLISYDLVTKETIKDSELVPDKNCNIYHLKYSSYFEAYPEKVSLLPGDKTISNVGGLENCARNCRTEMDFPCRGFEYCGSLKSCTLHKKHILDLKKGESGVSSSKKCVHYAAQYIADYMDLGVVLVDDKSDVRSGTSLEECAKICSEELKENCNSFNFCPNADFSDSTCALSSKLLRDDGVSTTENDKIHCQHFEKRHVAHDWDTNKKKLNELSKSGYTKKSFTGLVIGMLVLGLIVGVLGFVGYSYMRSRSSGDGMAVRFMKNDT